MRANTVPYGDAEMKNPAFKGPPSGGAVSEAD